MKCKKDYEFVVNDNWHVGHIELRKKNGEFVFSVACRKCLPELKRAIKKLEALK